VPVAAIKPNPIIGKEKSSFANSSWQADEGLNPAINLLIFSEILAIFKFPVPIAQVDRASAF
jgi:hypothetical protein